MAKPIRRPGTGPARSLKGWLDDVWPGEGVFPHAVAYSSGMGVLAGGFGSGSGDGGGTSMHHVGYMSWSHECGCGTLMVKPWHVTACSRVQLVPGVCYLTKEFQSRRVRGSKGSESGCNELVASIFYVGSILVNLDTFAPCHSFWV